MKTHGYVAYSHGCRCPICRAAKREYMQQLRARKLATGDLIHGTRTAYDCGCRCESCLSARALVYERLGA